MPSGKRWAKLFKNSDLVVQVELYYEHWKCHSDNDFFNDQMEDLLIRMDEMNSIPGTQCVADFGPTLGDILECAKASRAQPCITYGDSYGMQYYNEEGNNPMITNHTTATANVTQKTDLQTQREYLLGRWKDVNNSFSYGTVNSKMTDAFHLNADSTPKTSKELFDGITSGKYTLDAKRVALQEISAAKGPFYDEDEEFVHGPLYALNFGGLSPDSLGYETAANDFRNKLKLLKDQIMTGDPAASATALQALEAWTPPAAALAN